MKRVGVIVLAVAAAGLALWALAAAAGVTIYDHLTR